MNKKCIFHSYTVSKNKGKISLINSYLAFSFLFFFCDNVIAITCKRVENSFLRYQPTHQGRLRANLLQHCQRRKTNNTRRSNDIHSQKRAHAQERRSLWPEPLQKSERGGKFAVFTKNIDFSHSRNEIGMRSLVPRERN